jgi:hypothetical protein
MRKPRSYSVLVLLGALIIGSVIAPVWAQAPDQSARPVRGEEREAQRLPDQPSGDPIQAAPELQAIHQIIVQPGVGQDAVLWDAHIREWTPDDNYGNIGGLRTRPTSEASRALMRWNLTGVVPAGATITSAQLQMYSNARSNALAQTITAYKLLRAWDEATVTWNQAATGVPWTTAGCAGIGSDRDSAASASIAIGPADPVPGWYAFALTSLVQSWISDPGSNYGLILVATGGSVAYDFLSSESGSTDLRPKLVIEYSDTPISPTPTEGPSATPSTTPTATPTLTQTAGTTPSPSATPDNWLDVSRAVPAYCMGVFAGDTTGKPNNAYRYGDLDWPETGPEDVYILYKTVVGDVRVRLLWEAWGQDMDVFLLYGPNPSSLVQGGFGDKEFTVRNLAPGTYYIVVDGLNGSMGAYQLSIECAGEPSPTPTLTRTPTITPTPRPTNTAVFSYYPMLYKQPTLTPSPTPTLTPSPTVEPYARGVNCGGKQLYQFGDGQYYEPDQPYSPGPQYAWGWVGGGANDVWSTTNNIYGTEDDVVFQTHRYAMTEYRFNVPAGRYEVRLHFAEVFPYAHVGNRVFAVELEGQRVMNGFDMVALGFKYTAHTETFTTDVTDGILNVSFVSQSAYAPAINGIRVTRVGNVSP